MFRRFRAWREEREDQRFQAAYDTGYGWACAELLLHKKCPKEVEDLVFGGHDPFDFGAQAALREAPKQMRCKHD